MRRFVARQDGSYYKLTFQYTTEMIKFIKSAVPRRLRWWDPSGPHWTVHEDYLQAVLDQAKYMGFVTRVEHSFGHATADDGPPPPNSRTTSSSGDVTTDFAHLLSYDALHAAYRRASLETHPDRPGGDPDAMRKLNSIWDQIKRKFDK